MQTALALAESWQPWENRNNYDLKCFHLNEDDHNPKLRGVANGCDNNTSSGAE